MAKTWSADNPKAALMDRKRAAIVAAATRAFLDAGYAEASVNQIAADAGVSIKTLYRHFEGKDDLFSAVMQAACGRPGSGEDEGEPPPPWYAAPPSKGLALAGEEYLSHALSPEQLALYQVVTRDAHRFPEVGRRYHDEIIGGRDAKFAGYLDLWADREAWTVRDRTAASETFAGLLKAGIFDQVLQGRRTLGEAEIAEQAAEAGRRMLILLRAGCF